MFVIKQIFPGVSFLLTFLLRFTNFSFFILSVYSFFFLQPFTFPFLNITFSFSGLQKFFLFLHILPLFRSWNKFCFLWTFCTFSSGYYGSLLLDSCNICKLWICFWGVWYNGLLVRFTWSTKSPGWLIISTLSPIL